MASEDVPTTEQVRNNFALGVAFAARVENPAATAGDVEWPEPGFRDALKANFDAWLAERDRQVAERALTPLAAATQALLDVMTEIDGRRLIPACNAFTDDDGYCRVCTAMQNADQVLSRIDEAEP